MYKLHRDNFGGISVVIKYNNDGSSTSIPFDPANTDYQAYLAWLAEGNTPEPAEEQ
jgi:hypothetical protein